MKFLKSFYFLFFLISIVLLISCGEKINSSSSEINEDNSSTEPSVNEKNDCETLIKFLFEVELKMRECISDSDCTPFWLETYGSCGCTANLVVNKNADTSDYEAVVKTLNESKECGFQSDCHCDEVDGVICQDNLCRWNLIEVDYEITS
ncbi:MAG: hypothetical protein A3I75_06560 [Deltaproteobacteria bacterium RIFCSPLOWO2_02_FULL_50_16]|nr:MAG: hypothetical protein A3B79_02125 [Deltaproteobacteria bacterium RIFCSPHIGHO2_02_FULL_50_15]OGQ55507.1 MAG: hypothetical protein A3I75_06560 [Deltaproteobacteria bacterium RIFCSPLOWO2_02_FULL_50_16]OGQ68982.1 MAG: hypothetical protein A3F89_04310 [Deltaproteobacteria bacterium RIFCSPLOWO2_12_FULL_50_11]